MVTGIASSANSTAPSASPVTRAESQRPATGTPIQSRALPSTMRTASRPASTANPVT